MVKPHNRQHVIIFWSNASFHPPKKGMFLRGSCMHPLGKVTTESWSHYKLPMTNHTHLTFVKFCRSKQQTVHLLCAPLFQVVRGVLAPSGVAAKWKWYPQITTDLRKCIHTRWSVDIFSSHIHMFAYRMSKTSIALRTPLRVTLVSESGSCSSWWHDLSSKCVNKN